jgi:large subunit ribosomal protein L8e
MHRCKGPAQFRLLDYAEHNGYIKGFVLEVMHNSREGNLLYKVRFHHSFHFKHQKERFITA